MLFMTANLDSLIYKRLPYCSIWLCNAPWTVELHDVISYPSFKTHFAADPISLWLQQIIEECAIRILTGPQWACPRSAIVARKPKERRIGGWTPFKALAWKKGPMKLNKTDCAEKWEEKMAFVLPPWERIISCSIDPSEAAPKSAVSKLKKLLSHSLSQKDLAQSRMHRIRCLSTHLHPHTPRDITTWEPKR